MDSSDSSRGGRDRDLIETLSALAGLAFSVWMIWTLMVPEHRKTLMRMRLLLLSHRVTSELGRRTGVRSMGRELATGEQDYSAPYAWAMRGERLLTAYEQERDVTA